VAINTDHMHGLDTNRAMNPYNPFLAMSVAVTRKTEGGRIIGESMSFCRVKCVLMTRTLRDLAARTG